MKEKKTDLAAGRLGSPRLAPQTATDKAWKENTNYGVRRLGITSDAAAESPEEAQPQPSAPASQTFASPADTAWQPEVGPNTPSSSLDLPQSVAAALPNRGKFVLLAASALGGMLTVGLVLLALWRFGGGGTPQMASASEGSSDASRNLAGKVPLAPQAGADTPSAPGSQADTAPARLASRQPGPAFDSRPQDAARPGQESWPAEKLDWAALSASPEPTQEPAWLAEAHPAPLLPPEAAASAWVPGEMPAPGSGQPPQTAALPAPKARPAGPTTAPAQTTSQPSLGQPRHAVPPKPGGKKRASGWEVSPAGIQVSCIMRGPSGPVAIINNRLLGVGKTIDKAKIVRIEEFGVEIELEGRRFLIGVSSPGSSAPPQLEPAEDKPAPTTAPADAEKEKP
ncbi:MAG: hypothetical protein AMJ81_14450 [Phycisphaerae bacterium SM23_33]|nr:MAG: hypothetical protein AMJ81_14450 [Phycisphaerae bacterium SM23_33]